MKTNGKNAKKAKELKSMYSNCGAVKITGFCLIIATLTISSEYVNLEEKAGRGLSC